MTAELFAGETLMLSMVSEDLAAICHLEDKDKVGRGRYGLSIVH